MIATINLEQFLRRFQGGTEIPFCLFFNYFSLALISSNEGRERNSKPQRGIVTEKKPTKRGILKMMCS